jgi:hypothetical protein
MSTVLIQGRKRLAREADRDAQGDAQRDGVAERALGADDAAPGLQAAPAGEEVAGVREVVDEEVVPGQELDDRERARDGADDGEGPVDPLRVHDLGDQPTEQERRGPDDDHVEAPAARGQPQRHLGQHRDQERHEHEVQDVRAEHQGGRQQAQGSEDAREREGGEVGDGVDADPDGDEEDDGQPADQRHLGRASQGCEDEEQQEAGDDQTEDGLRARCRHGLVPSWCLGRRPTGLVRGRVRLHDVQARLRMTTRWPRRRGPWPGAP